MATLVLSTVGNALGGPVGSAIGALIGQSIDQQLLAPAQRGPRVGDLAVQTSTFGTQIPRIYGTMRVAGSVIWSTDLIEHEQAGGAKGQPDVTFGYTVSLAVALSSRPIATIGRIWADGKLLRGEAGDLKVSGTLRVYEGGEDQVLDPLIGSIEGINSTPAYRGLALAVFEDLELAEFGNRIPFLTFEVVADVEQPTAAAIMEDASGGAVRASAGASLQGYAAYGRSIRTAIEPLVDAYGIHVFDDGNVLRSPDNDAPVSITAGEFGNSADGERAPRLEREQVPARAVPSAVRIAYYDPARDYQTAEARAAAGEDAGVEAQQELPGALTAGEAKSLAQTMLARAWSRRDKLALRLPRRRMALEPGDRLQLPLNPPVWFIERITVDGFVPIVDLRPVTGPSAQVSGDSGRIVANDDVVAGPPTIALIDIPAPPGTAVAQPTILLAASQETSKWRVRPAEILSGGQSITAQTARSKSVLGHAVSLLQPGTPHLTDDVNSVEVQMVDADQWLIGCDEDALATGANLAVIGSEVVQFGIATSLGEGRFRLSRLLRGRGGTEWASSSHAPGEIFCLLRPGTVQPVALPDWSIGADVSATVAGRTASVLFGGEALRPPSPVKLSAEIQAGGEMALRWTRRSRLGFSWIDGVDAPLGESSELYRITLTGPLAQVELEVSQPVLTVDVTTLASIGPGAVTIRVVQVGDLNASRPAELNFIVA